METIAELFQRALRHHQGGELAQAEALYRQILAQDPGHADSMHLLGFVEHQKGNSDVGVALIRRAIALNPSAPVYHGNLGIILIAQGFPDEAIASYRNALRLYPRFPDALCNLAIALQGQGRLDEALDCTRRAVSINPRQASAYNIMGNILKDQGMIEKAVASYRRALEFQPHLVDALGNLGLLLRDQGKLAEAEGACRQALSLDPRHAPAYNTLGIILKDQGKADQAVACFEEALRLKPDYFSPRWNLALYRLGRGELARAWPDFEIRWKLSGFVPTHEDHPRWDGTPFPGNTLLIYAEQGMGDTLHFIRYAAMVKERGGKVLLECQPALCRLLAATPGVDEVYATGAALPAFDLRIPLLSLPGIFGTTMDTIPAEVPYVRPTQQVVERWRPVVASLSGYKIGICWQGSPNHANDHFRSVALERFVPLAQINGVHLVSLQKGPGSEQLAAQAGRWRITDLASQVEDFADTAAIIQCLDLVITVDTAVAHCAGALGAPVWTLLPFVPEWRWFENRSDSPWYPTMRLFRQSQPGAWDEVFAKVANVVQRVTNKMKSPPT